MTRLRPPDPEVAAVLTRFLDQTGCPGAAASVFTSAGGTRHAACGVASVETGEGLRPTSLFRMQSVTKLFTCVAALLLAGERSIDLDGEISSWCDDPVPSTLRGVTLRHLLSHSSGLMRGDPAFHARPHSAARRPGDLALEYASSAGTLGAPGQVYEYSDAGITLLRFFIERTTAQPYPVAMSDLLFRPAGMAGATIDPLAAMTRPLAQRHERTSAGVEVVRPFAFDPVDWAFSGAYASVLDLEALGAFLVAAQASGSPEILTQMPVVHAELGLDIDLGYGLGCYAGPRYGDSPSFGQIGYARGSFARVSLLAADPFVGVAWCDNLGPDDIDLTVRQHAMEQLLELAGAGAPDWARRDSLPLPNRADIAGRYRRATGVGVLVEVVGEKILIGDTGFRAEVVPGPGRVLVFRDERDRPAHLPWTPHDYSGRCCIRFVGPAGSPPSHVVLNGTAFPRITQPGSAVDLPV